jgi:nucleotide-binding universal stress UspA family protein
MAPTLVREPFHRDGWVYEEKVDGWRILAYKDGERVRLLSRHGRDHTRRFADLATAVAKLSARTLVLDGEVAIFDRQLRSRFDWLREPDPDAVASPPLYMAFDLLYRDRRDQAEAEGVAALAGDFLTVHGIPVELCPIASAVPPAEVLLEEVRRRRPRLLVMGAHGHHSLRDLFGTSVTRAVLRECPVPTFVGA